MASLGSDFFAINIATLDLSPEEMAAIPVSYIDGRNDRFDAAPAIVSYL